MEPIRSLPGHLTERGFIEPDLAESDGKKYCCSFPASLDVFQACLKEGFLFQSPLLLKLSQDAPDLRKGLDGCFFTLENRLVPF